MNTNPAIKLAKVSLKKCFSVLVRNNDLFRINNINIISVHS